MENNSVSPAEMIFTGIEQVEGYVNFTFLGISQ